MTDPANDGLASPEQDVTAVLILADGTLFRGAGLGRPGKVVGEVCFNTAMTGYQEILTDPSYAGQIITFTFPHIGNVGTNDEDIEANAPAARGFIVRETITPPSSFRSQWNFGNWARDKGLVGIAGVDTRRLTRHIRLHGAPNGVLVHAPDGKFDLPVLLEEAQAWPGLEGMDLAKEVTTDRPYSLDQGRWRLGDGYQKPGKPRFHVVAVDYGIKRNILRCLASFGAQVTVVPCTTTAAEILDLKPDGIFLSNGPGDPAATGKYAIPELQALIASGLPIFGICLGHQLLALAAGAKTYKMHQGHRGANHPVKDFNTNKVEITSMNHGFSVDATDLPDNVEVSHISLFDQSVCGLQWKDKPVFSVQHHPEASPGPQDSHYLFARFIRLMEGA
ncbi:MAG: glutamine-hydrolyzing carbamoyl-phosphate synthase small subunit [Proteobacteria bacterium]|nr:glutamine-hydrolyzing carbamoyl-phosphate synthase small subunit [Pseudomonadota bacterium]